MQEAPEESEPGERTFLSVHFSSLAELESVYRSDIGRGGIFVALSESLPLREPVEVEFTLEAWSEGLRVEGEVVRCVEESGPQGTGVAVAFTEPMADLRAIFEAQLEVARKAEASGLAEDSMFEVSSGPHGTSLLPDDSLGLSVIDLARSGLSLKRILEVIPENENQIRNRVDDLLENGFLALK